MKAWLLALGIFVVLLTNLDFLQTTITTRGAGPLTGSISRVIWWILSRIGNPKQAGYASAVSGPLILVVTAGAWVIGLWVGWALVFAAGASLADTTDQVGSLSATETLSFIGITLSTLGVGVIRPTHGAWHFTTAAVAMNGMIVLTLSVSYLLNILTTVLNGRALATRINALGPDASDVLLRGWTGHDFSPLASRVSELGESVTSYVHDIDAFSIASYFGHVDPNCRPRPALAKLHRIVDALRHLVADEVRPHPFVLDELWMALDGNDLGKPSPGTRDVEALTSRLRAAGVPMGDDKLGRRDPRMASARRVVRR